MSRRFESWGRYPTCRAKEIPLDWTCDVQRAIPGDCSVLPHGLGRSYGDVCLNPGGRMLTTLGLNRILMFDRDAGIMRCEAGVGLADILDLAVPAGWFPPVTPGTKSITVAGAVANDVHGKNHHRAGTFGCHLRAFELVRSDGVFICSADENRTLFEATIGGLGLTGVMTWVEFSMRSIPGPGIDVESIRFRDLDALIALTNASDCDFEHTVAWIDLATRPAKSGRGIFMRGNHAPISHGRSISQHRGITVPMVAPNFLLNRWSMKMFNWLYYHRQRGAVRRETQSLDAFFYPLDGVGRWNRLYGSRGFLQYQCVVPDMTWIARIIELILRRGESSFLSVLKRFGDIQSPGMMSFPKPGWTLALDVPVSARAFRVFDACDQLVTESGGRVYPAKDARMSASNFSVFFPDWERFSRFVDPAFSSGFWRRMGH